LRSVRMVWLPRIRDDAVVDVARALSATLTSLDLSKNALSADVWPRLGSLEGLRLTHLRVDGVPAVTDETFVGVAILHLPTLERLEAGECPKVSVGGLLAFLAALEEVRRGVDTTEGRSATKTPQLRCLRAPLRAGPPSKADVAKLMAAAAIARVDFSLERQRLQVLLSTS
jgi:hypothetical protein